jgi:hypothetical protein
MVADVSTMWKLLIGLGLLLPSGAFVAGVLAASTAESPAPRETIVIQDATPGPGSSTRAPGRRPERSATPLSLPSPTGEGVRDDNRDGDRQGDDDGVEVITPNPDNLDDVSDDRGRDGETGGGHGDDNANQDHDGDHGGTATSGPDNNGDADDDNSGPGGDDDGDDDNSGPGGGDDDGDNSGPGGGGDDDGDDDNSGHGGGDDDDPDDDGSDHPEPEDD